MGKQFLSLAPEPFDFTPDFGAEPPLKKAAQTPGEGGAASFGGNGEGERTATDHGGIVEVAAVGIVDDVHENAAAARQGRDAAVQIG